jgi:hypothetical protein
MGYGVWHILGEWGVEGIFRNTKGKITKKFKNIAVTTHLPSQSSMK